VRLAPDTGDVAALAELPAGPLSWQVQTIASGRVYVWRTLRNLAGVEILAVDARTGSRQRHATLGGAISISFDARGKGWWWEGSSLRSGGPW
jgi:hypothetical protein